jgi:hypothetical protein
MSIDKENSEDMDLDLKIEIVDDTPEEDRGKKRRPDGVEPDIPDDDEIATYSGNVQKRLKKLKYEFHEERRRKDEALREHAAAVSFAEKVLQERNVLAERLSRGEEALIEQAKRRAAMQLEQAERQYRNAHEMGDTDALLSSQKDIMRLTAEQQQLDNYRHQPPERIEPQRPQQAQNEPDEKAKTWLKSNPWFGNDEEMSGYAYGVHERLIKREGITPLSDNYYQRIDAAMQHRFPEYFDEEGGMEVSVPTKSQPARRVPVVAPATRSVARSTRTVQLTPSQIALAKRFKLTPEQYAAQMIKDEMNG